MRMSAILILAFLEGAAVMVIELTAARLMIPYFGQTVFVWTNIIGIILAAVAVGNYFGGLLADKSRTLFPLFLLLMISGVFCLFIPHIVPSVAAFFLGEGLPLNEAFPLLIRGSFATALLVFAPPVLLAGACLPFLVKAASEVAGVVGRASGSVYGCSTLGSIAGTFVSTYVFIEALGSKRTFYLAGLTLIVISIIGWMAVKSSKKKSVTGLIVLFILSSVAYMGYPSPSFRASEEILFETESRYQYVCVRRDGDNPDRIRLCLNEDLDSFHSLYSRDEILTGGQYYDYYCLLPCLAGMSEPERVCILGLAAGTTARQYAHFFSSNPKLSIDGVEIDEVTVEAGRKFMDLDSARHCLELYPDMDGRIFLQNVDRIYDTIIIDAYAKQVYIPFQLTTREFFSLVHDHLCEGGIMGMNVNGYFHSDPVVSYIANTAASVFGSVSVAYLKDTHNFMIYAVRGKGHVDPTEAHLPKGLEPLTGLLDDISAFGLTRKKTFDSDLPCFDDNWAPVELLCDVDLIDRAQNLLHRLGLLDRLEEGVE